MKKNSIMAFLVAAYLCLTSCGGEIQAKSEKLPAAPPTDYVSEEEMKFADMWKDSKEDAIAKVMKKRHRAKKLRLRISAVQ